MEVDKLAMPPFLRLTACAIASMPPDAGTDFPTSLIQLTCGAGGNLHLIRKST